MDQHKNLKTRVIWKKDNNSLHYRNIHGVIDIKDKEFTFHDDQGKDSFSLPLRDIKSFYINFLLLEIDTTDERELAFAFVRTTEDPIAGTVDMPYGYYSFIPFFNRPHKGSQSYNLKEILKLNGVEQAKLGKNLTYLYVAIAFMVVAIIAIDIMLDHHR